MIFKLVIRENSGNIFYNCHFFFRYVWQTKLTRNWTTVKAKGGRKILICALKNNPSEQVINCLESLHRICLLWKRREIRSWSLGTRKK
ncbi:BEM_collapsed_G0022060.mRNA.1.CDS.1 [Saccharomyces cerevisiae]|nr:BEM_collapsed_G0022060.mRNA.1.CDS.1 [Saccharomyces cerevisiae]